MFRRTLWAPGLALAAALAGCSPSAMIDKLPADMGLPANTPSRPEAPYQYPAVHDMPPDRAAVPMSEEEQFKLEKELANACATARKDARRPVGTGRAESD